VCYEDRATASGHESEVISNKKEDIVGSDPSIWIKFEIVHGRNITVPMMRSVN